MVQPRPIPDLDPAWPMARAARGLLQVRCAEVAELARLVDDPAQVAALHELRVAVKRLRYLVDLVRPWLVGNIRGVRQELAALQDLLGAIHDCDVAVDDHRRLLARRLRALRRVAKRLPTSAGAADARLSAAAGALSTELSEGAARGLCLLMGDLVERRQRLYESLTDRWERLAREGFLGQVLALAPGSAAADSPGGPGEAPG